MGSNIVIVIAVLFLVTSAPLNRQAAALDGEPDPVQQCSLGRKQPQDCFGQRDTVRVKDIRQALFRDRERIRAIHSQSDLLQELLDPQELPYVLIHVMENKKTVQSIRYKSREQKTGLLEELVETPAP